MSTSNSQVLIELHYLPSIQYFSTLLAFEAICIEQHENYQKGSYRNRCHIVGANGFQAMSIPLKKGKHQKLPIQEVELSYTQPWHLQHWRSLQAAYANAPFFPYYSEPIKALYESRPTHLFAFNKKLLELICRQIGISDQITYSKEYLPYSADNMQDLRDKISPKPVYLYRSLLFPSLCLSTGISRKARIFTQFKYLGPLVLYWPSSLKHSSEKLNLWCPYKLVFIKNEPLII